MTVFMRTIAVVVLLLSAKAFAHIEEGKWLGKNANGTACEMLAGAQTFENAFPHPLNERIKVIVNGDTFQLYHPRLIEVTTGTAGFDHDHFQAELAIKGGAKAIVVDMAHSETFEGPTAFHFINHDYKTGKREVSSCRDLQLR